MRFWKAGAAAAIVIGAAAAVQFGGAKAHGQEVRAREIIREPLERAVQVLRAGGGSRIGVVIDDVTAADVTAKTLPSESGVIVREVETDTPASRAGLQAGDVILEFDGERVRSVSQLRRLIQETPAGRRIAMSVSRDGQRLTLAIEPEAGSELARLQAAPRPPRAPRPPTPPMVFRTPAPEAWRMPRVEVLPDGGFTFSMGGGRLGVSTQTLGDQLAKHFGVERGVLVTSVTENSAASKAGVRAGDVITKVDAAAIGDTGDLVRALGEASGEVTLEIVRDRKAQTLKATLEPVRSRTIRRVI
ncbi:MAG TPA: PDZ domain-containing protein [Vicinamibacterales bacterium]